MLAYFQKKAGNAGDSAPTVKTAFSLLDKKNLSNQATCHSPRKQTRIVMFQEKMELMKEVFDDSSCSLASQSDQEVDEQETLVKRQRSVSNEKMSAKKKRQEQSGQNKSTTESLKQVIKTSPVLDRGESNPTKTQIRSPAYKSSFFSKKKGSIFSKFSEKLDDDEVVKPKFQFDQAKEEQKPIKDHFSFGKDKKSVEGKPGEGNKENGPQRRHSVKKSKIFEEELPKETSSKSDEESDQIPVPKKSVCKNKKGKEDIKKSIDKSKVQPKPVIKHEKYRATKAVFKFSDEDKAQKSKNSSSKSKVDKEKKPDMPSSKVKESISNVFDVEDDPYVVEIMARNKKESDELADRTKAKTKGRKRGAIAKMAEFSQSIAGSQSSQNSSQESESDESGMELKIPKISKARKKKEVGASQKKVKVSKKKKNYESDEVADYTPSIDELLKLPDRPGDVGKTMDEVLDDLDKEIADRKQKHEEEMAKIDTNVAAEKKRQEDRRERMKENALLRNRLEVEISESVLRKMFKKNMEYFEKIWKGKIESSRHKAFKKSVRTRHALYYTMITDPFTDDQLEWTLEEIGKVWMKTKREQMDNNEYVWKVLLAECFIKFYMDHFGFEKEEAEKRIRETPLRKTVEDDEGSSEDEV